MVTKAKMLMVVLTKMKNYFHSKGLEMIKKITTPTSLHKQLSISCKGAFVDIEMCKS